MEEELFHFPMEKVFNYRIIQLNHLVLHGIPTFVLMHCSAAFNWYCLRIFWHNFLKSFAPVQVLILKHCCKVAYTVYVEEILMEAVYLEIVPYIYTCRVG